MNHKIYLMMLLFSARLISMQRCPTPDELKVVEVALAKASVPYNSSMRAVKKPMVGLIDVDQDNTRYLVDLQAQLVVNKYNIAQRPSKC